MTPTPTAARLPALLATATEQVVAPGATRADDIYAGGRWQVLRAASSSPEEPFERRSQRLGVDQVGLARKGETFRPREARGD